MYLQSLLEGMATAATQLATLHSSLAGCVERAGILAPWATWVTVAGGVLLTLKAIYLVVPPRYRPRYCPVDT